MPFFIELYTYRLHVIAVFDLIDLQGLKAFFVFESSFAKRKSYSPL
ncbi:MAG: hypothetical protein K6G87_16190 [Butyrivibrio sp.]|nr:hypothetical protein [Butyrivibrio sp.]MCR5772762.1 hypothetical protein [Butyrivibrio sp.]